MRGRIVRNEKNSIEYRTSKCKGKELLSKTHG